MYLSCFNLVYITDTFNGLGSVEIFGYIWPDYSIRLLDFCCVFCWMQRNVIVFVFIGCQCRNIVLFVQCQLSFKTRHRGRHRIGRKSAIRHRKILLGWRPVLDVVLKNWLQSTSILIEKRLSDIPCLPRCHLTSKWKFIVNASVNWYYG